MFYWTLNQVPELAHLSPKGRRLVWGSFLKSNNSLMNCPLKETWLIKLIGLLAILIPAFVEPYLQITGAKMIMVIFCVNIPVACLVINLALLNFGRKYLKAYTSSPGFSWPDPEITPTTNLFVITGTERRGPYVISQVKAMWETGVLTADAILEHSGTKPTPITVALKSIATDPSSLKRDSGISLAILLCALGLVAAFFMPWVQVFGAGICGYQLGQLGSFGNYLWIIPILAAITVIVGATGSNTRDIGFLAGIVPLAALGYAYYRLKSEGGDIAVRGASEAAQRVAGIGIYFTIILCVAITILTILKKPSLE